MTTLQKRSTLFYLIFRGLFYGLPLCMVFFVLFQFNTLVSFGFLADAGMGFVQSHSFSFLHRVMILLVESIALMPTVMISYCLAALFKLYERGHLFDKANIKLIKRISLWMITGQVLSPLYQALMSFTLTFNNPPGKHYIILSMSATNVSTLLTAFIILFAAMIVEEAKKLQDENALTV